MAREFSKIVPVIIFVLTALGIAVIVYFPIPLPWNSSKSSETYQTRIVVPHSPDYEEPGGRNPGMGRNPDSNLGLKVPLNDSEIFVAVLTGNFSEGLQEEQFVAYRSLAEPNSPVYLSYAEYDYETETYRRLWSAPSAATVPATVSLYTKDLAGDRSLCVLLAGMNDMEEQTLTIFRMSPGGAAPSGNGELFSNIAELRVDGSITVRETARSQAYQMGLANGESFAISTYGSDAASSNVMDQVEYIYTFNIGSGIYEESRVTRIPGIQIEQRRVQELLGSRAAFEEFVTGLWYYISPEGGIDSRQYIYFDSQNKEIIFYGDETQQVFIWQNSAATRYGLYIASQNISVSTMRRSIDISLESLESIQIKVFEDVRLRFMVIAPWDGSYRKAGLPQNQNLTAARTSTYINASYDSSMGKISFSPDGNYEILAGRETRHGKYAFFILDGREILELRHAEPYANSTQTAREIYIVESGAGNAAVRSSLTLERIRLGARGIERLYEGPITLNLADEGAL